VLQALTLLVAAFPEISSDEFSRASLGQRDAWLLALRERLFGSRLDCVAECPRCRQRSEFSLSTRTLLAKARTGEPEQEHDVEADGYRVRFRLPDSLDLDAASSCDSVVEARDLLLSRVVLSAQHGTERIQPAALSAAAIEALERRLAECDPLLEILIDVACPACDFAWQAPLDVVSAVVLEVSSQARRILREVHTLARHYHWSEPEIFALSDGRRQAYLELVAE
jgi:hypothetical protein